MPPALKLEGMEIVVSVLFGFTRTALKVPVVLKRATNNPPLPKSHSPTPA